MFKKALEKLKAGLSKTRSAFRRVRDMFSFLRKIDDAFLEELEEALIGADIGVQGTQRILETLKLAYKSGTVKDPAQLLDYLKADLKKALAQAEVKIAWAEKPPTVILVVGVNGTGKTTSVAKLARWCGEQGKKVLLAASDTFRAAAIEQISIWSERIGVDLVRHKPGADPSAVAYDAVDAAIARGADVVIVDTAGRLHTQQNLMKELEKIHRVIGKKLPGAPHETILVLDATTGQNAVSQAALFHQSVPLTGLFLAKLDGTAKGGIVLAIKDQLSVPVKFVGLGEKFDDIETFDPDKFVDALFD